MSQIEKMQSRLDDAEAARDEALRRVMKSCPTLVRRAALAEIARLEGHVGKLQIDVSGLKGTIAEEADRADAAEAREFALGVQVQALKERLRLAEDVVGAARNVLNEVLAAIEDDTGHDEPWFVCPRADLVDALAAFDAVPGDVSPAKDVPPPPEPDTRPRYASGEVPMVRDVVTVSDVVRWSRWVGTEYTIVGVSLDGSIVVIEEDPSSPADWLLVRRAAPPASTCEECATTDGVVSVESVPLCRPCADESEIDNLRTDLARAVALLREHAYDVRVRDFLADFDKGGV